MVFGSLRGLAGRSEFDLELSEGASVADAIVAAGLRDRVDLWVLVDGRRAEKTALLTTGAKLTFFPPSGGG